MKYIYLLIIPILIMIGCTSSDSEKMDKDIKNMRRTLDSLKAINNSYNKTLDSLDASTKAKEEQLLFYKQQMDSLNKNLKEMEEMEKK